MRGRQWLRWLLCYTLGIHVWYEIDRHACNDKWCVATMGCRLCNGHDSKVVRRRRPVYE